MASQQQESPVTGILAEDMVFLDFSEHEGKSILEVSDTHPNFYQELVEEKSEGRFSIRRCKDKTFRLFVPH